MQFIATKEINKKYFKIRTPVMGEIINDSATLKNSVNIT